MAKRPVYLAAFVRSGALSHCSCSVPIPIGPPPKNSEVPSLAGGAHVRRRVSTSAPAQCLTSGAPPPPQMRRSALPTWLHPHELAPSAAAPAQCLPLGASQKWRSTLSRRWCPREAAPIYHYLCLVPTHWCPTPTPKCGEALYLPARRHPRRAAPSATSPGWCLASGAPKMRRSALSTWWCTHEVASSVAEPA